MTGRACRRFAALALLLTVPLCWAAAQEGYQERMDQARIFRLEGKADEARRIYDSILRENPEDVDALVGRGFCFLTDRNTYPDAETDFRLVLALTPEYVDASFGLALVKKRTGDWKAAKQVLEESAALDPANEPAMRYLSSLCWQIGHFPLARSIDRDLGIQRDTHRELMQHDVGIHYAHDWVKNRPDWDQTGVSYTLKLRPDFLVGLMYTLHGRGGTIDQQLGLNVAARLDMNWSMEYSNAFSLNREFLAIQKHHAILRHQFPTGTGVGAGFRFDRYSTGWGRVGWLDLKQYIRMFYGQYELLAGVDGFDETVITHIARLGLEMEGAIIASIGYSYGNESFDTNAGPAVSSQLIQAAFLQARVLLKENWSVGSSAALEFRDDDLFRGTLSLSAGKGF